MYSPEEGEGRPLPGSGVSGNFDQELVLSNDC